ncbi:MAG: cadmium-translocating P-type ATPase [Oscillospiraceae bacterium]|nr:cadmium-translocating P-type ATPase [Oscillospiraceae bacterium]
MNKKQKRMLTRIVITAIMAVLLNVICWHPVLNAVLSLLTYLLIGYDILRKAGRGILAGRIFSESFLMAAATLGTVALAVYSRSGEYLEAIAVMLFFQIGELFESYAVGKSRRSISQLMDIRPDYARIETDGVLTQVDPEEVAVGSILVVQPGERIPIDGVVIEGSASLNTGALTGESLPRDVAVGDDVISGCINLTGVLKLRTTKSFGESTVSKILDLVENASSRKSKSENFIAKFARVYTPAVCCSALVLALLPPVVRWLFLELPPDFATWVYRALTFLVISCPCALVISIPLSFFAGIGGASRAGVLIKGSNYLETLAKVKTVVFDKTGTLTKGVFEVIGIYPEQMQPQQLLELAACVEAVSSHPIAKSILSAYGQEVDRSRVAELQEISGYGMVAKVDGKAVAVGSSKLMEKIGVDRKVCADMAAAVHIAVDGTYAGYIRISDSLKPTAHETIEGLKKAGIRKTVMLTGDADGAAQTVGAALGLDEVHSQLLPADKVAAVERLLEGRGNNDRLAFVGDGINDAPVLARADIGIAMGAMGSDAAIEAADVVLMDDDPVKLLQGIRISRKCISIVYQNIIFALAVKFACLALGAAGIANMWLAIFADVGVMVLAVLNAIRALK